MKIGSENTSLVTRHRPSDEPAHAHLLAVAQSNGILVKDCSSYSVIKGLLAQRKLSRAQLKSLMTHAQLLYYRENWFQLIGSGLGAILGFFLVTLAEIALKGHANLAFGIAGAIVLGSAGWRHGRISRHCLEERAAENIFGALSRRMPQPGLEALVNDDVFKCQCWMMHHLLEEELKRRNREARDLAKRQLPLPLGAEEKLQLAFTGHLDAPSESGGNEAHADQEVV